MRPASPPTFNLPIRDALYHGRWILLAGMLVGLGFALVGIVQEEEPTYQTHSLVRIQPQSSKVLSLSRAEFRRYPRHVRRQIRQMQRFQMTGQGMQNLVYHLNITGDLSERLASRLLAQATDDPADTIFSIVFAAHGERLNQPALARRLGRAIRVDFDDVAVAVLMRSRSTNPQEAVALTQLAVEELTRYVYEEEQRHHASTRQRLETALAQQTDNLSALTQEMQRIGLENADPAHVLDLLTSLETASADLEIALQQQVAELEALEAMLDTAPSRLREAVSTVSETEWRVLEMRLRLLKQQQLAMERDRGQTPEQLRRAPDYSRLTAQITELEAEVDSLGQQFLRERMQHEQAPEALLAASPQLTAERLALERLQARKAFIDGEIERYREALPEAAIDSQRMRQFIRQRRVLEKLQATQQVNLARVSLEDEVEGTFVDVIRPPTTPTQIGTPTPVHKRVLYGLFMGFLGALALTYARFLLDTRLHDPGDFKQMGLPLLGVIPDLQPSSQHPAPQPISHTEAFRLLYTHLHLLSPDRQLHTLVITSPTEASGKTNTTLHLGALYAQAGLRTLLIDADLRRPSLHKRLKQARTPGVVDVLREQTTLANATQPTGYDDLLFLPAGHAVPSPSDWLHAQSMHTLLAEAKQAFDIVLIDTPPILVAPDAAELAAQADGVLLMTAAHRTDAEEMKQTLDILHRVRATVLGGVLNRFIPQRARRSTYRRRLQPVQDEHSTSF